MQTKPTIWIFSLEPLETRYTCEWHKHIPHLLKKNLGEQFNVVQIDGVQKNTAVTSGAFLNFSDTNYWKSSQLCGFLEKFNEGEVGTNDHFLFTDAWNPTVLQLKYMKDLLGHNWTLHGLWHAGSYDFYDFLGRIVGDKPWIRNTEAAMSHAFDHNYFATKFHATIFANNLYGCELEDIFINSDQVILTGWPMEYMASTLEPYKTRPKRDLILFPHRVAPEKQVEIFKDLAAAMPQYEWVVCQDRNLTKREYHGLLGSAKIVFSANLQETLGISTCAEGPLANAIPLAPARLSYEEIFDEYPEFLYPSEWTESYESYTRNYAQIINRIQEVMTNYDSLVPCVESYVKNVYPKYFTANELINQIRKAV